MLEQGIGGDGGAEPYLLNQAGGYRRQWFKPHQLADGCYSRIPTPLWLNGEHLAHPKRSRWITTDDIGEGATSINPETPAAGLDRMTPLLLHHDIDSEMEGRVRPEEAEGIDLNGSELSSSRGKTALKG